MFRSLFTLAIFFFTFAGRALALNIVFGGALGNITASQLLEFPQGPYSAPCMTQCMTANSSITTCGDTNDQCLCTNTIGSQLQACEECLFTQLIDMNIMMPDPRVGSTPALAAFSAACLASVNVTLAPLVLTDPASFVGPRDIILNTGATVVVVGFGAILGGSALWMLSNI